MKRLETAEKLLADADLGSDFATRIPVLSDLERDRISSALGRGLGQLREASDAIDKARKFASVITVKTLNAWGRQAGFPVSISVDRSGDHFLIGETALAPIRIKLAAAFDQPLTLVPAIGVARKRRKDAA